MDETISFSRIFAGKRTVLSLDRILAGFMDALSPVLDGGAAALCSDWKFCFAGKERKKQEWMI